MAIYCWMWIKVDIFCCFLCSLHLFYTCIFFSFITQRVIHEEQKLITLHEFNNRIVMGSVLSISSFLCRVTLIIVYRCILFFFFFCPRVSLSIFIYDFNYHVLESSTFLCTIKTIVHNSILCTVYHYNWKFRQYFGLETTKPDIGNYNLYLY